MFNKYRGNDLRSDVHALIEECRRETTALAARVRAGKAGYGARGRAEALKEVVGWLENIAAHSLMQTDLATNITDCLLCLQQGICDEEETYAAPRRKRLDSCEQRRLAAMAQGRAGAYASVQEMLSDLLKIYYPNKAFPMTFTGGLTSYDEWKRLESRESGKHEWGAFEPFPDALCEDERQLLSQIEEALLEGQNRILVQTERHTTLALTCIDRLLRSMPRCRVLVLLGQVQLKAPMMRAFKEGISPHSGKFFSELYCFQERPTAHLENGTQICFATLREMQALIPREAEQQACIAPDRFDVIVVYGMVSAYAEPMWGTIMRYLQASYCLGFSRLIDRFMLDQFGWNVVCQRTESVLSLIGESDVGREKGLVS